MPRIEVASEAGACFGVERALGMVDELARVGSLSVATLGPLIHNPRVIGQLEQEGVRVVEAADAASGSMLVLRTHGSTPAEEALARETAEAVTDATCPLVKRVHRAVERMYGDGRTVVVVGEAGHPEVVATMARAEGSLCVGSAEEAAALGIEGPVGVVAQTTITHELFEACCEALSRTHDDVEVADTICDATTKRQAAARELAERADCMIVIGGKNSANTRHLYDICAVACPNSHHIESPDELDVSSLEGCDLIGITAGASTPAAHIEELLDYLHASLGIESS